MAFEKPIAELSYGVNDAISAFTTGPPNGEVCPFGLKQNKRRYSGKRHEFGCPFRRLLNKKAASICILDRRGIVWLLV